MKNLSGKVAAVTGAGSGIGRALAINLAQNGCNVALSDVNEAGLAETAEMLKQYPIKITTQKLDVSDKDAFYAWADQVVADHGKANLVFNNAGVALAGTVGDLSIEDYKWIMDINFYGVLYGTKAFLPHMEKAGEGHIVNISSIFGLASQPLMSGYNASKFAVRGLTESLRQGRSGIRFKQDYADMGFRSHVAGTIDIDFKEYIDRKTLRFMGDAAAYSYISMQQAIEDANLTDEQVSNVRTGLIMGSGGASSANQVEAADILRNKGLKRIGPYRVTQVMGSTTSACLATPFKIKGVNYSMSSACATSAHCIGTAMEQIH